MSEFALKMYSWKSISALFNGHALIGNEEQDKVVDDFGKLWQLFANDYADSFSVDAITVSSMAFVSGSEG